MSSIRSLLQSAKRLLGAETAEAKASVDELERKLDADLTRRERQLAATPEEQMDSIQSEIDQSDDLFVEIQPKVDSTTTHAELAEPDDESE